MFNRFSLRFLNYSTFLEGGHVPKLNRKLFDFKKKKKYSKKEYFRLIKIVNFSSIDRLRDLYKSY